MRIKNPTDADAPEQQIAITESLTASSVTTLFDSPDTAIVKGKGEALYATASVGSQVVLYVLYWEPLN